MIRAFSEFFSRPKSAAELLKFNLGITSAIFVLLEIWRPCFFLTDDNLSVGLPFLTAMGRHLKSGQSPFVSDYLFGGHYNLLRDCSFFTWHPIYFLVSLLSDTAGRFWMLEIVALFFLLLATAGFVALAGSLRRELGLKLSDGRLTFYTQSFVFSTYVLTAGASWANVLGNQSALPWLAWGLLQRAPWRGLGVITLFSVHQILGGQFAATLSNDLFLSLFALGVAVYRQSWRPLAAWGTGNLLALLAVSPLLLPTIDGFLHSQRSQGLEFAILTKFSVPLLTFPCSFFFGNYTELLIFFQDDPLHNSLVFPNTRTLLACAAAWCLLPALLSRVRWHFLEQLCLGLAGLLVVLIIRPEWISQVMLHVPVLRSMRWPFREILQFQFFIHLFLVLRPQRGTPQLQTLVAAGSLAAFLLPMPFNRPPTMNPLAADRELIFSGKAERFWAQVKTCLKPDSEIVSTLTPQLWIVDWKKVPYCLLDSADFPDYFQVKSVTGYSMTAPLDQVPLKTIPILWFGTYLPGQLNDVLAQRRHLEVIWLESVDPLRIMLYSKDAPPLNLTRFLSD